MNATLKEYVVSKYEALTERARDSFLYALKFSEAWVLRVIVLSLQPWADAVMKNEKKPVQVDPKNDPAEILAALKEHFATELSGIVKEAPLPSQTKPPAIATCIFANSSNAP